MRTPRRSAITAAAAVAAFVVAPRAGALSGSFYMGGDVSLLPFIESRGGSFRDNGAAAPADRILAGNGTNLFRLRLFVNPDPNYDNPSNHGAIQDLDYTIALARRLKDSGARVLLDFHYSDTWADPGKQFTPAAWNGQNLAQLAQTTRAYTRDALLAMRDAGVMPDMVQVGNEVTNGMLWPSGRVLYAPNPIEVQNQSWRDFGTLLNAGISGVRDADAQTPGHRTDVAVHIDGGNVQGRAQYFYNQITSIGQVSGYDTFAMSFYPVSSGALNNLQGNLNYLATSTPKKVMVNEFNYPWKGTATGAPWPSTQAGQRDALVAVRDLVRNLPNDRGAGVVWWYPEGIQVPGTFIFRGGAIALFDDTGGDALPALDEVLVPAPAWNAPGGGDWDDGGNWTGGVIPDGAGAVARFGPIITAPATVTLAAQRAVGSITFLSAASYTIAGPATLTLDATGQPARIDVLGGNHTIAAPLALADDAEVNVAWTNQLVVTGVTSAAGRKLTKLGSGTVQFENLRARALNVQRGTVKLSAKLAPNDPAGTSVLSELTISPGGEAAIDLTNNALVIDYTGAPGTLLADVREHLRAGRLAPSSGAVNHRLGYVDNALLNLTTFAGQEVDSDSVLVAFTRAGDANLDGVVNLSDFNRLAANFGGGDDWLEGDFNYDGAVNLADFNLLAANFGLSAGADGAVDPSDWSMLASVVPEPVPVCLLGVALAGMGLRRCRNFK